MQFPIRRFFWPLLIGLVLLSALGVRLLTFERTLPYVDYPDEANMFLLAVDFRDDFPLAEAYGAHLAGTRLAGYPPLYPWIAVGTQHLVEAVSTEPFLFSGDYVYALRLLAVGAGVLTAAALVMIGWVLGGPYAGVLSGLVWALSPVVVEWNSLAIPDPLVYLASAATLAFALWAWHTDSPAWTLPCLLAAIAAIYLKYTPLHVLVAWGGVVLVLLRRDWRRMLPWLIAELLIGLACAAYLAFGYGALRLENDEAMRVDPAMAFDLERGLRNLGGAILPVGGAVSFGVVLILMSYAYAFTHATSYGGRPGVDWRKVRYLLMVTLVGILSVSTFIGIEPSSNQMRHVLPVSPAVIGLWSMLVIHVITLIEATGQRIITHLMRILVAGLFVLLALPWDLALIQRLAVPDSRYALWQWFDASLPPDGKILMFPDSSLKAVWNRPYSGYDGQTAFDWAFDAAPYRSTPQALYDQGVAYFVLNEADRWHASKAGKMGAFLNSLLHLKTIPTLPPQDPDDTIEVYRLIPPQVPVEVAFGESIRLVGYDLDISAETIQFRPYWQAASPPAVNYSLFVHLTTEDAPEPLAQYDGSPASARRPATSWDDLGETLIGANTDLHLPADLPAGTYQLRVGLYDYETGQRLPVGAGDAYTIAIQIGSAP